MWRKKREDEEGEKAGKEQKGDLHADEIGDEEGRAAVFVGPGQKSG